MDTRFLRNRDLIPQHKLQSIQVIGLGGTGSVTAQLLAIMGYKRIVGYDNDILEKHNLSTCVYVHSNVTSSKAKACKNMVLDLGCPNVVMHEALWTSTETVLPVAMLCTDNMEVRKEFYTKWKKNKARRILIDMRMDALSLEIITTTKDHDYYMEYWTPSTEIEDAPCTMKHTIFTGTLTASLAINQLFCTLTKKPYWSYIWKGLVPLDERKEKLIYGKNTPSFS